jgi:hypothetical protein
MKNKKGEIATLLTLGLVIVGTIITLGTSLFVSNQKSNLASNSRAACASSQCTGSGGKCYNTDPAKDYGGYKCCNVGGVGKWLVSCTGTPAPAGLAAGTEGGDCRTTAPKCDGTLTCTGGKCVKPAAPAEEVQTGVGVNPNPVACTGTNSTKAISRDFMCTSTDGCGSYDKYVSQTDHYPTVNQRRCCCKPGAPAGPAAGAENGACRTTDPKCDTSLTCSNGKCVKPTSIAAGAQGGTCRTTDPKCDGALVCIAGNICAANSSSGQTANQITTSTAVGTGQSCCFQKKGKVYVYASYQSMVNNQMLADDGVTPDCGRQTDAVVKSYQADKPPGAFVCAGGTSNMTPISEYNSANAPVGGNTDGGSCDGANSKKDGNTYGCFSDLYNDPATSCKKISGQPDVYTSAPEFKCSAITQVCCKKPSAGGGAANSCEAQNSKNDGNTYGCFSNLYNDAATSCKKISGQPDVYTSASGFSCNDSIKVCCKKPAGAGTGGAVNVQCSQTPMTCVTGDTNKKYYVDVDKKNFYSDSGCTKLLGDTAPEKIVNYCAGLAVGFTGESACIASGTAISFGGCSYYEKTGTQSCSNSTPIYNSNGCFIYRICGGVNCQYDCYKDGTKYNCLGADDPQTNYDYIRIVNSSPNKIVISKIILEKMQLGGNPVSDQGGATLNPGESKVINLNQVGGTFACSAISLNSVRVTIFNEEGNPLASAQDGCGGGVKILINLK